MSQSVLQEFSHAVEQACLPMELQARIVESATQLVDSVDFVEELYEQVLVPYVDSGELSVEAASVIELECVPYLPYP